MQFSNFVLFRDQSHIKDSLDWNLCKYTFFSVFKTLLLWSMFLQPQKNDVGALYSTREKKINELKRWTDKRAVFRKQGRKTRNGNKEIIIFIIARKFKQLTLTCKSKKIQVLFYICTFRNFRKRIQIFSLTQNKNVFSRLKFAWIPFVHDDRSKKRAAGELFSYTYFQ